MWQAVRLGRPRGFVPLLLCERSRLAGVTPFRLVVRAPRSEAASRLGAVAVVGRVDRHMKLLRGEVAARRELL